MRQKYTSDAVDLTSSMNLMKFMIYVLNSPVVSCIDDGIEISKMVEGLGIHEVFICFLESVIENRDLRKVSFIRGNLEKSVERQQVIQEVTWFLADALTGDFGKYSELAKIRFKTVCSVFVKVFEGREVYDKRFYEMARVIRRIYDLADKFNIFISFKDYQIIKISNGVRCVPGMSSADVHAPIRQKPKRRYSGVESRSST